MERLDGFHIDEAIFEGGNAFLHWLLHRWCGKGAQRDNDQGKDVEHFHLHPGIGSLVHHRNATSHKAVVEAVGKGDGTGVDGLADEQVLILRKPHSLLQHMMVCLIFVDIAKACPQQIDKGIPPLHHLNKGE